MTKIFHVYILTILASQSGVLYTGVTSHLERRIWQHKRKENPGFTRKYNVKRLVWFEAHGNARSAIAREKEIKGWLRTRKIALVEAGKPQWEDLIRHLRS